MSEPVVLPAPRREATNSAHRCRCVLQPEANHCRVMVLSPDQPLCSGCEEAGHPTYPGFQLCFGPADDRCCR